MGANGWGAGALALLLVACGGKGEGEGGSGGGAGGPAFAQSPQEELRTACEAQCETAVNGTDCPADEQAYRECDQLCTGYEVTVPEGCELLYADMLWCLSEQPHACGSYEEQRVGEPEEGYACAMEVHEATMCFVQNL
jgi:hypothetical protein